MSRVFNLLLGIYRYVAGDDTWDRPFPVTGYRDREFEWSHGRITEFLSLQLAERARVRTLENTKIWPVCVAVPRAPVQ